MEVMGHDRGPGLHPVELRRQPLHHPGQQVHDRHIVAQLGHNTEVMGDKQNGCTHVTLEVFHELDNLCLYGDIQSGGRLIGDEQFAPRGFGALRVAGKSTRHKLGQPVAFDAMDRAIELADQYGIGQVSVDNAFHYLWGGGYVMEAAKKGYIAYTNCTSALAEVVPFGGKFPTLGTNPHSWAFPTTDAIGFPLVIDWATSAVAMGRVQQFKRENKPLPEGAAVDANGVPTTDPNRAVSLLPFGAHKGYGLMLINELVAALIGGFCFIALHWGIGKTMGLHFHYNMAMITVFFINIPFWIYWVEKKAAEKELRPDFRWWRR